MSEVRFADAELGIHRCSARKTSGQLIQYYLGSLGDDISSRYQLDNAVGANVW